MKITDVLKQKDKGVAFEFFPPKKETGKKALASAVKTLAKHNPLYASMTYGAAGGAQENTKESVQILVEENNLVVMPHLTCVGQDQNSLESLLSNYQASGIKNIMALRGDVPKGVDDFDFSKQDLCFALDLVKFIKQQGDFCVGVAVYPEGHIEASSLEKDLEYTKMKIDAGADFAITQMFFDNNYFYSFLDRMQKKGITIPILPGILPLTDINKIKQMASVCKTTIPKDIELAMSTATSLLEQEKIGIDFTIRQCKDLINKGAGRLHFFTLNKPELITNIIDAIN